MSVKIRLKRMGSKKRPFYRIIATDSRMPRDGRFIETVGFYNPLPDPPVINVKEDLLFKWFERGAKPTANTASLLRSVGYMQKWELMKQGLSGEVLEQRVIAIRSQRATAAVKKQAKKKEALSEKAKAKESKESEAPEAKTEAKTKAPPDAETDETSETSGESAASEDSQAT